ncbi:MAG TPA: TlpA disulfide reductase family protein [Pyrinomonadaceae bacterium]|nr:TlpA disulfide reductase family protein [Pyrinomonadaceae bacterium]
MSPLKIRTPLALALTLLVGLSNFSWAVAPRGASAPLEFTLRAADGGQITSSMLRGDVVVLAFGATWLPSLTRRQVEGVQKLADQFGERNVRVYWVSTDSERPNSRNYATDAQLRDFARKNGLKVAVLRDPDGALLKKIGIDQMPAVVLLDREGNVSGTPVGGLDPAGNLADQLAPRLNRLLGQ